MAYNIRVIETSLASLAITDWIALVPGTEDDASMHLSFYKPLDGYSSGLEVYQIPKLRHEQMAGTHFLHALNFIINHFGRCLNALNLNTNYFGRSRNRDTTRVLFDPQSHSQFWVTI